MGEDEDVLEWSRERVEEAADALAHKLGARDRDEAFRNLDNGDYDGKNAEVTLSAYRHLLSDA